MASVDFSVSIKVDFNNIPTFIEGLPVYCAEALEEAAQIAVLEAEDYTPWRTGELATTPVIRHYGGTAIYVQWLANNKGFYYGGIQNTNTSYFHDHGGPFFMEETQQRIVDYAPGILSTKIDGFLEASGSAVSFTGKSKYK